MKYIYQMGSLLLAVGFGVLFLGLCYWYPLQQTEQLEQVGTPIGFLVSVGFPLK